MMVNVEEPQFLLRDLDMYCYRTSWTLLLSYSVEEAAEYLENLTLAERRDPAKIIDDMQRYRQQRQLGTGRQEAEGVNNREVIHVVRRWNKFSISDVRPSRETSMLHSCHNAGRCEAPACHIRIYRGDCSGQGGATGRKPRAWTDEGAVHLQLLQDFICVVE